MPAQIGTEVRSGDGSVVITVPGQVMISAFFNYYYYTVQKKKIYYYYYNYLKSVITTSGIRLLRRYKVSRIWPQTLSHGR